MLIYHTSFKPPRLRSQQGASIHPLPLSHVLYSLTLSTGAVCSLCWSPDSTMFAVASVTGSVQIYQGSGREYNLTNEIKETQVCVHSVKNCVHTDTCTCIVHVFHCYVYRRQLVCTGALRDLS